VTLQRVDRSNHRRLLKLIGNIPLAEAKNRSDVKIGQLTMASYHNETTSGNPGTVGNIVLADIGTGKITRVP
jgi:hypothetical protein